MLFLFDAIVGFIVTKYSADAIDERCKNRCHGVRHGLFRRANEGGNEIALLGKMANRHCMRTRLIKIAVQHDDCTLRGLQHDCMSVWRQH